ADHLGHLAPGHVPVLALRVQRRVQLPGVPPEALLFRESFSQAVSIGVRILKTRDKTLRRSTEPEEHAQDAVSLADALGLEPRDRRGGNRTPLRFPPRSNSVDLSGRRRPGQPP